MATVYGSIVMVDDEGVERTTNSGFCASQETVQEGREHALEVATSMAKDLGAGAPEERDPNTIDVVDTIGRVLIRFNVVS